MKIQTILNGLRKRQPKVKRFIENIEIREISILPNGEYGMGCKIIKQRDMDFKDIGGPDWFWKLLIIFGILGILTFLVAFCWGVYYLLHHIKFI